MLKPLKSVALLLAMAGLAGMHGALLAQNSSASAPSVAPVDFSEQLTSGPRMTPSVSYPHTRSLDLVELNPFLDERGRTAKLLVDLTCSLFGKRILDRQTRSY